MVDDSSVTIRCSAAARDRFNALASLADRSTADVLETLSYAGFSTLLQCNSDRVLAEHRAVESKEDGALEVQFHEAMGGLCRAEERLGHRAEFLPKMLKRHGGVATAQRLLRKTANWQHGFEKLRRDKHLHISVENMVLLGDFPKLFRNEELDEARRRLRSAGVRSQELARELEKELRR